MSMGLSIKGCIDESPTTAAQTNCSNRASVRLVFPISTAFLMRALFRLSFHPRPVLSGSLNYVGCN
jgi:hypothetical protein